LQIMLTALACRKNADELEQAAERLHLRSHRERYNAVAAEWRALAEAIDQNPFTPINPAEQEERQVQLRDAAAKALDSPLRRALLKIADGWGELATQPS
jgi:hypothetical protein